MATIDYTITVSDGFRCPRGFPPGTATRKECLTCGRLFECLDDYMESSGMRGEMRAEARAYQRYRERKKEEKQRRRARKKQQPLTVPMADQGIRAFGEQADEKATTTH